MERGQKGKGGGKERGRGGCVITVGGWTPLVVTNIYGIHYMYTDVTELSIKPHRLVAGLEYNRNK